MAARWFGTGPGAGVQILLVAAGLAGAVLVPPARGSMVAVPLTDATPADTVNLALAHGATIERIGGDAGWVVLRGDRARLSAALWARGVVLLAAPSSACSS